MLKSSLKVKENLCIEKFGSVTANCLPQTDKCGTSCEKIEGIISLNLYAALIFGIAGAF
jgi:hypothetical protein